jgi:hypothetical protein
MLCKIGFTDNFNKRDSDLCSEYKCNNKLVSIREVNNENDEKAFHSVLQKNYPNLVFHMKLKNKNKEEIYIMHPKIVEEFHNAHIQLKNQLYIEKEKTKQLQEKTKQLEILEKTKQVDIKYQFIRDLLKMNININDIKKLI